MIVSLLVSFQLGNVQKQQTNKQTNEQTNLKLMQNLFNKVTKVQHTFVMVTVL